MFAPSGIIKDRPHDETVLSTTVVGQKALLRGEDGTG